MQRPGQRFFLGGDAVKKLKPVIKVIRAKPANAAPVTLRGKATDTRGAVDYSKARMIVCPSPVSVYRHQYDPTTEEHRAYVRQLEALRNPRAKA